jgi:zinc/manganese transport system substrate-binding protein
LKILCALLLAAAPAKLQVVATLPDLAAIAKQIGGARAEVTALSARGQDPHYVDARPSLMLPLNRADLVIENGLGLEVGWLPPLLVNARNEKILRGAEGHLDASSFVSVKDVVAPDRSKGDIHPGGNPHFLLDPREARAAGQGIAERMAKLDPEHSADYWKGFETFAKSVDALSAEQRARFQSLPPEKRRIVVFHASMVYLAEWLGLEQIATIEPLPGIPPNPGHVAKVLEKMRSRGVKVILQEDFYPREPGTTLAKLAKAELVVIPTGTHFDEGETYADHIHHIAEKLYGSLLH